MKKYLFVTALMLSLFSAEAQAQVFKVEEQGGWITVFDEAGGEHSAMSSDGVILGASGDDFFVISTPQWIISYDMNCKAIAKMSNVNKKVIGGSAKLFTVRSGQSLIDYDRNCRQISVRSVNPDQRSKR